MGPAPIEGLAQAPTELMFETFYCIYFERIKPILKREVNWPKIGAAKISFCLTTLAGLGAIVANGACTLDDEGS